MSEASETIKAGLKWYDRSCGSPAWAGHLVLEAMAPAIFLDTHPSKVRDQIVRINTALREAGCPYGYKWVQPCDPRRVELGLAEVVPIGEAGR